MPTDWDDDADDAPRTLPSPSKLGAAWVDHSPNDVDARIVRGAIRARLFGDARKALGDRHPWRRALETATDPSERFEHLQQ